MDSWKAKLTSIWKPTVALFSSQRVSQQFGEKRKGIYRRARIGFKFIIARKSFFAASAKGTDSLCCCLLSGVEETHFIWQLSKRWRPSSANRVLFTLLLIAELRYIQVHRRAQLIALARVCISFFKVAKGQHSFVTGARTPKSCN